MKGENIMKNFGYGIPKPETKDPNEGKTKE